MIQHGSHQPLQVKHKIQMLIHQKKLVRRPLKLELELARAQIRVQEVEVELAQDLVRALGLPGLVLGRESPMVHKREL